MIQNVILIFLILLIIGAASFYIYRQKKKGAACIGCPYADECRKNSCCAEHKH